MTLAAILNLTLALGVTVMVVTPLAWAILTQHRDRPSSQNARTAPGRYTRRTPSFHTAAMSGTPGR